MIIEELRILVQLTTIIDKAIERRKSITTFRINTRRHTKQAVIIIKGLLLDVSQANIAGKCSLTSPSTDQKESRTGT